MGHKARTDERILTEAARWQARLAADDCTDFERAEFQRWRAASRHHANAYGLAESLCGRITQLASADDRLQSMADEAFAMGDGDSAAELDSRDERAFAAHGSSAHCPAARGGAARDSSARASAARTRRWAVPASLAAAVLVAFVGVRLPAYFGESTPRVTYSSPEQGRRDVTLPDGSLVHLDVGSEISVTFSEGRRQIALVEGRALFEVAHDATRPFVVSAGQSTTTALGTHFQVQREGPEILVTLTGGSIAVESDSEQSSWRERLVPGEQISLSADGRVHGKRTIDMQAVTSWSRGRLVFRGTPLGEALQEVNRYASRKVRLGDPELAALPVGGNFIAGETELIVSAFAAVLPLRVVQGSGEEIILFRRYKTGPP